MYTQEIYDQRYCAACYFRSTAKGNYKKALLQLTEQCNLKCEHCFVSSTNIGKSIDFYDIEDKIIPFFIKSKVKKVTLTGGEPFAYPKLLEVIELLEKNDIEIAICTNGLAITEKFLESISHIEKIHFNVSLDGFSNKSHNKFRGGKISNLFDIVISNIKILSKYKRLNGILVTPNVYASIDEYVQLCEFARSIGARYVLMNPLSKLGRGEEQFELGMNKEQMIELQRRTQKYNDEKFEVVYIRFPNNEKKPLSGCLIGKIYYIFTNGNLALCPYMAFACQDKNSAYAKDEFIVCNVITEKNVLVEEKISNIKETIDNQLEQCNKCLNIECNKGCYAAKIAEGNLLQEVDKELCPIDNK